MEALKALGKPPFANYDIVVYFGGGLFALPFIYRYLIHPLGIPLSPIVMAENHQVTLEIIRALSLLMAVYVVGHLIAFLSSQLIEKAIDRYLGKVSTAIIVSTKSSNEERDQKLRDIFVARCGKIKKDNALLSSIVRAIFHFPNYLHYLFIWKTGIFGYLDSRVPPSAFSLAKEKYKLKVIEGEEVSEHTKWYKSLEYYIINNIPSAVPRMYNYLVMAGLFRSLGYIFLMSAWMVIFYLIGFLSFGTWPLGLTDHGTGDLSGLIELISLSTASVFSIMMYLKFQRRYAEEAILALAFSN